MVALLIGLLPGSAARAGVCGDPAGADCCAVHVASGCSSESCCNEVCALDPFCCAVQWDWGCVTLACDLPVCACSPQACQAAACGNPFNVDCCFVHNSPGCDDAACCNAVCAVDPFCCLDEWTALCVQTACTLTECDCPAQEVCGEDVCGDPAAGSCCDVHRTPGCSQEACCVAVCLVDPFCCDFQWDMICRTLAYQEQDCPCPSDTFCGNPDFGSCCFPDPTPFCDDLDCCDAVCQTDPFCCEMEWDSNCVALAYREDTCPCDQFCGNPAYGHCCVPNHTPFCNDSDCCQSVCTFDPFCCQTTWDYQCASWAGIDPNCYCPCLCPGDLSRDGLFDGGDIHGFAACLVGFAPNCDCAELDGIKGLDSQDLAAFVQNLLAGTPCGG